MNFVCSAKEGVLFVLSHCVLLHREKAFREVVPPQWAQMNGDQFDPVRAPEPDDHTGDSDAGEYPVRVCTHKCNFPVCVHMRVCA